jgi:mono/diheme cytochrome c family protein
VTGLLRFAASLVASVTLAASAVAADPPQRNSTQIENAYRGLTQDRTSHSSDEALYVEKCSMCHRQMGMGTVLLGRRVEPSRAMLEARTDLDAEQIATAVRTGLLNMPRISRGELSDAQLARIIAYLTRPH